MVFRDVWRKTHASRAPEGHPAAKTFALKIIPDHKHSTESLKKALACAAVTATLPTEMHHPMNSLIESMQKAAPKGFDKTYMDQQVAAHDEAVFLFKGYADHMDTDVLKSFATKTLPTVQDHL